MGVGSFLKKVGGAIFKGVTAPASLALDAISMGVNAITQNSINKENNRNQRVENELNRDYNAEQAQLNRDFQSQQTQLQNQFSLDQWNRQNDYNSASAQMQRAQDAGLNPNLVASSIGGASPTLSPMSVASGSAASFNGSVSPSSINPRYGDVISQALANDRQRAEINYIKAQTKGQNVTNDILSTESAFKSAFMQSQLDLNNSTIYLNEATKNAKESEIQLIRVEMTKLNAEVDSIFASIDETKSRISNLDADTVGKIIDNSFKSDYIKAQIAQMASQTNLNYQQAYDLAQTLTSRLFSLQASSYSAIEGSQSIGIDDSGNLTFDFRNNQSVSRTLREIENSQKIMSSYGSIADSISRRIASWLNKHFGTNFRGGASQYYNQ